MRREAIYTVAAHNPQRVKQTDTLQTSIQSEPSARFIISVEIALEKLDEVRGIRHDTSRMLDYDG